MKNTLAYSGVTNPSTGQPLTEAALPDKMKSFKQLKQLLRKRRQLWLTKGPKAATQIDKCTGDLHKLNGAQPRDFPLEHSARGALLGKLCERTTALHDSEKAVIEKLAAAVK